MTDGGFWSVRTYSKKIDFAQDNGGPRRVNGAVSSHHTDHVTLHGHVEETNTTKAHEGVNLDLQGHMVNCGS